MTILVLYKQHEKTVFVSDFRVSFRGASQVDAMSKFLHFDNRLAFFTAGSVRMWNAAVEIIPTVISQVDYQNVCEEEGPLFCCLRNMTEQNLYTTIDPGFFGGYGIYVDPSTNQNIVFQIEGQAGNGLRISKIDDGISVLGSGSSIPEIEHVLQQKMDEYVTSNGFHLHSTADKLRSELKGIFSRCGSSVFEKMGISPIFNISGLVNSSMQMFGEELVGANFVSGGPSKKYHFSFELMNGEPTLHDVYTNVQYRVHNIVTFPYDGSVSIEFDPEGLTEKFDPSSYVSGNKIYFLSQWVENSNMERVVFKTSPFTYRQMVLANPNYVQLAIAHGQANTSGQRRHKNIYRIGLLVSQTNQETFEQNIQANIMDDNWLSTYVENADQLFSE